MNIESLLVTVIFIIPGFIITGIKHSFHVEKRYSSLSITIESLICSLFLYTLISLFGLLKDNIMPFFDITINQKQYNLLDINVCGMIWIIVTISLVIGWIFGVVTKSSLWLKLYEILFKRTIYKSVWHEIADYFYNDPESNGFVEIKFKDNDVRCIGKVERMSDYDDSRELYLSNVHYINPNTPSEQISLNCEGMLVKYDSLEYIIISPDGETLK